MARSASNLMEGLQERDAVVDLPLTSNGTCVPNRLMIKVVGIGNIHLRVHSIGYLAMALDRSSATIRRWQRAGVIPAPIIKTMDGARWYLKEEIETFSKLAKQFGLQTGSSIEKTGFPRAIATEISELKQRVVKKSEETNEAKSDTKAKTKTKLKTRN